MEKEASMRADVCVLFVGKIEKGLVGVETSFTDGGTMFELCN